MLTYSYLLGTCVCFGGGGHEAADANLVGKKEIKHRGFEKRYLTHGLVDTPPRKSQKLQGLLSWPR